MFTRHFLVVVLAVLATGPHSAAGASRPVGINLAGIHDWSSAWPFVDAFKTARSWISHSAGWTTWDDGRQVQTTPEGWVASLLPNQYAGTLLFRGIGANYPAGEYVCRYEGTGQIEFRFAAQAVSVEPGRIVLNVTPNEEGIHLSVTQTDPADPVRNIRVIMPGFEQTYQQQVFHPEFLASIEPFSTIRFMDWMSTNNSLVSSWAGRSSPETASYATGRGVPVEVMADLCNRLGADAWFCIPHLADDDFVRRFAETALQQLDPGRRVYIEHSNEVWNGIFTQNSYAYEQAAARGIPGDAYQSALRYHSERSVEIFDIFDDVFPPERLVRVLAGHHSNPWTGTQIMDWQNAFSHADAYATAPYFGGSLGGDPATQGMSVAEVLESCRADLPIQRGVTAVNATEAHARGLELIAYEGGQHLVVYGANSDNQQVINRFIEANRDPFMRDLYRTDLAGWEREGGGVFCSYSHINQPGRYGSWGMLEYQLQPREDAPKWLGVMDHAAGWSCPGDFNLDLILSLDDLTAFVLSFQATEPAADINADGTFDLADLSGFVGSFLGGCP